ncbi:MAG: [protein-PII] uridylyltransferase [Nitrospirae bacterium]|nr:MAG: [protein-PII] uridylyltransferase [Nitrospirota bacterium]
MNLLDHLPRTRVIDQAAIQEHRRMLAQRLAQGATGAEIIESFTEFIDALLIARYRETSRRVGQADIAALQHCCLVAIGGYGRRELAPYSDIDVMLLYRSGATEAVADLSKEVFHHLWDLGFQVGHSVRSIPDCLSLAETDLTIRTALMEARFLAGAPTVFHEFRRRFARRFLGRRADAFIQAKLEERQRDYAKFGETIYLLEPNVKKSKGGLRDVHVLQWVGMAKYQAATLQELVDRGLIAHQDYVALLEAREFLWRVRAFLHCEAGRAQDILSFDEQVRLAEHWGFHDQPHLLAVEQFMQHYYRHTRGIYDRCLRFVDRSRRRSWAQRLAEWLPAPLVEGSFRITGKSLTIPTEKLGHVLAHPELLLRLFRLAQERALIIESRVLEELQPHLETMPNEWFHTPHASRLFRQILTGPGPIAETLDAMHRAYVLEKLIPAFARVRGLMQFNQYHKYTVDEHSLLAVKHAEMLAHRQDFVGTVYRDVPQKDLVHLALLLHDLGKGRTGDHSEVGREIAQKTAARLSLTPHETHILEFLVHKHLLMAHTAFRRDIHDDKVLLRFAREVKTPDMLKQLFVLTVADIAAVGPEVMTKWKEALLIELFARTLAELTGGREAASDEHIQYVVREVVALVQREQETGARGTEPVEPDPWRDEWVATQLQEFPSRYVTATPPALIVQHLRAIRALRDEPQVLAEFDEERKVCEYTLITNEHRYPSIFLHVTGVLAGMGLEVLNAHITTRRDGIVVDRFVVHDPDYDGRPPRSRLEAVSEKIVQVLTGREPIEQVFARGRRFQAGRRFPTGRHPTEVHIDNETSDQYTVIDVFADDRQGLLYVIAKTLHELGLSVGMARIGTKLDQVADVFYVTGPNREKIDSPAMCERICTTLQQAIDRFLDAQI